MKKAFKFHLLCDIRSEQSALRSKLSRRNNNNSWKMIVRLQKIEYKEKNNEKNISMGKKFSIFY